MEEENQIKTKIFEKIVEKVLKGVVPNDQEI
jgi:hypothetical protein